MYYPFQFCIHESYTQILTISTPSSHFGVRVGDCIADIEIKWYLIESGCCFWRHQPNRCRSFDSYHGTSSVGSLVDLDVFRLFCAITRRILLWLTISVFPFFCFLFVFKSCAGLCFKQRNLWINIYRKCPNSLSFTAYPSARSGYTLKFFFPPIASFSPLHDVIWEGWLRYCKGHLFLEIQAILYHLLILCKWRLNRSCPLYTWIYISTVFLIVTLS